MRIPGYKPALMLYPNEGPKSLEVTVQMNAAGKYGEVDLFEEMSLNEIAFVQAVWIDNSKSNSTFELDLPGIQGGQRIVVQPNHQGWYSVSSPVGTLRFTAYGNANQSFTIIFTNVCMPPMDWGPSPGVLVVPALITSQPDFSQIGDGTVVLIAPVVAKSPQIYRAQLWFDTGCTVQFKDSGGGILSGKMTLFAGGVINWQASGVPWLTAPAGLGVNMVLTNTGGATIGIGGLLGYQEV